MSAMFFFCMWFLIKPFTYSYNVVASSSCLFKIQSMSQWLLEDRPDMQLCRVRILETAARGVETWTRMLDGRAPILAVNTSARTRPFFLSSWRWRRGWVRWREGRQRLFLSSVGTQSIANQAHRQYLLMSYYVNNVIDAWRSHRCLYLQ